MHPCILLFLCFVSGNPNSGAIWLGKKCAQKHRFNKAFGFLVRLRYVNENSLILLPSFHKKEGYDMSLLLNVLLHWIKSSVILKTQIYKCAREICGLSTFLLVFSLSFEGLKIPGVSKMLFADFDKTMKSFYFSL